MSFFRELGRLAGKATGAVIGGAVNVVGEMTGSQWIKEVGDGVKKASEFAGDTFGQAVDGVWNTASGIIQKDEAKIEKGLGNIGESISRTVKGVYQTAKHTYQNGKEVYEGLRAFLGMWIARTDGIGIRFNTGEEAAVSEPKETKPLILERAKARARAVMPEVVRNNVSYLQRSSGTVMYEVLSSLRGW